MTLKELKYFISSLPKEDDNQEVKFTHLSAGYASEYDIKGYYKSVSGDNQVVVLTDIDVVPKV